MLAAAATADSQRERQQLRRWWMSICLQSHHRAGYKQEPARQAKFKLPEIIGLAWDYRAP